MVVGGCCAFVCFDVFSICIYLWTVCLGVCIQLFVCVCGCLPLCVLISGLDCSVAPHAPHRFCSSHSAFLAALLIFLSTTPPNQNHFTLSPELFYFHPLSTSCLFCSRHLGEKHTQTSLDSFHLTLQKISFWALNVLTFFKHFLTQ